MVPQRRCQRVRATGILVLLLTATFVTPAVGKNISTLPIPQQGKASLTHYDLTLGALASCVRLFSLLVPVLTGLDLLRCGCSTGSTYFPTAALSQAAYGSSLASGPACGQCLNLTLLQTYGATPEWLLNDEQRRNASVVVKITVRLLACTR